MMGKKTLILMALLTVGTMLLATGEIFEFNFTPEAMKGVNLKNIAKVEQDNGDNVLQFQSLWITMAQEA